MAKMIYYCKSCGHAYSADSGLIKTCPDCQATLYETPLSKEKWDKMLPSEKEAIKEQFKENCNSISVEISSNALLRTMADDLATLSHDVHVLYMLIMLYIFGSIAVALYAFSKVWPVVSALF